jgi:hypothetical protein
MPVRRCCIETNPRHVRDDVSRHGGLEVVSGGQRVRDRRQAIKPDDMAGSVLHRVLDGQTIKTVRGPEDSLGVSQADPGKIVGHRVYGLGGDWIRKGQSATFAEYDVPNLSTKYRK